MLIFFKFFKCLMNLIILISFTVFTTISHATQTYITLDPPIHSDTPDKIEVLVFFSYACTHCAKMEPLIAEWSKSLPSDILVKKIPIAFNSTLRPSQYFYFTLQIMNRLDLHPKVLHAIFKENKWLFDNKHMREWIVSQGVELNKFDAIFDSFSVQAQVKRANQLTKSYKINEIPMFAVGGKYLTSPAMAGNSYGNTLTEINKLISMIRIQ